MTRAIVVHPGPHFSVADVHNGVVKGLRNNGVEVMDFNLDRRLDFYVNAQIEQNGEVRKAFEYEAACTMAAMGLEAACYRFWPDVVIVMSGFFLPPEVYKVIRARRQHLVLWCTESPYEDDRQLDQAHAVDTVILNDPTNIDRFRERNPRTWYLPHSYDPDLHYPGSGSDEWRCDFGFVGTGYPSRVKFFEQVDWTGVNALFAGNWMNVPDDSPLQKHLVHARGECIDNRDTAELYRSCKVSANLYRKEAEADDLVDGWAMGPREVELAACRTFFLREPRFESDALLWMYPTFDGPDDLGDQVRWWVDHPNQRDEATRKAAAAVADRTFNATTAELLRLTSG
jgi:spore maturation protein CgeB